METVKLTSGWMGGWLIVDQAACSLVCWVRACPMQMVHLPSSSLHSELSGMFTAQMQAVAPVKTSHKLRLNPSCAPWKASIGLKINQSVQLLVETYNRADPLYFTTLIKATL